jgi:hydroxyethylthiazole kinase-like uncharacterized protein yjeF
MAAKRTGEVERFASLKDARLIVDAIFGAGLSRAFPNDWADAINGSGQPVVAIDVPSGLDGGTGFPAGSSVKADLTITFFRKKPGHVLMPGRKLCGEICVADIGIPDGVLTEIRPRLIENTRPALPHLDPAGHKYSKGHAVVVSGSALRTGASRLAAHAALKAGAGLVTLSGERDALLVHAAHVSAVMLSDVPLAELLADRRKNALCAGPALGTGEHAKAAIATVLQSEAAAVLDADALTAFADDPEGLFMMIGKKPGRGVVLTPHEGEFSRLFNGLEPSSQAKHERALAAARASGAVIVLKGPDTVIAAPEGHAAINTNAPASLATAGSGDVLAGIITGLLAQAMEPYEAACAGVWMHGEAAQRHGGRGLTAETLLGHIGHP